MKAIRILGRVVAPLSLVVLAACQTTPKGSSTVSTAPEAPQPETSVQAQQQGAPIAVFLADTVMQANWTPVNIDSGMLYVNPQPVITRGDLIGIQAGTNKQGEGLLALELNEEGKNKVADITTKNPNKRLALVVGRTMLAAPGYTTPVMSGQLIFAVGTEANATAAARAVAGVPSDGAATGASTPSNTGGSTGTNGAVAQ